MGKKSQKSRYVDYGGKTDKYSWDQDEDEVVVTVPMGTGIRGKDVICEFKPGHLKLGKKGNPPIIDGELYQKVLPDDCAWIIGNDINSGLRLRLDGENVEITLQKAASSETWWKCVIVGDPEIDVKKIEGAKYLDDSLLKKIKEKDDEEKRLKEEAAKAEANAEEKKESTAEAQKE